MIGFIELLAIGYALFAAALIVYTAWSLTHPHRKTYAYAVARGRPGDPSELPGAGREYRSWTFVSRGRGFDLWDIAGDDPAGPTAILSHGWADSRLGGLVRVQWLAPACSRLIVWDGRGHGAAPGISHLGTREVDDLLALIEVLGAGEHAAADRTASGPRIVLYGWSLGAGASIAAAARCGAVVGVVAEAPYRLAITPARNVLRSFGLPWRVNLRPAMWLLGTLLGVGPGWRGFDRAEHAARLSCPLLVIHGAEDSVCPPADGREIAAAAPRRTLLIVEGAGHNNLWTDPAFAAECGEAVTRFIRGLSLGARSPTGTLEA